MKWFSYPYRKKGVSIPDPILYITGYLMRTIKACTEYLDVLPLHIN